MFNQNLPLSEFTTFSASWPAAPRCPTSTTGPSLSYFSRRNTKMLTGFLARMVND